MAPAIAKLPVTRKRNRKRKRRAASSSSSSSSSSVSDSEEETRPLPPLKNVEHESSSSDSSDSDSESDSPESSLTSTGNKIPTTMAPKISTDIVATKKPIQRISTSPSPPPPSIPSFLPSGSDSENDPQQNQLMRERFRKFWLSAVVDGFKDDLEEIRKEPNLGTPRLALLIDSLATGADVFPSQNATGVNEVEVVLS